MRRYQIYVYFMTIVHPNGLEIESTIIKCQNYLINFSSSMIFVPGTMLYMSNRRAYKA